jgi:hypothetical protein
LREGRRQEGRTHIVEVEPTIVASEVIDVGSKQGENLMMRKILLQLEKEVDKEPK